MNKKQSDPSIKKQKQSGPLLWLAVGGAGAGRCMEEQVAG
jgi:hypothetical protein